MSGPARKRVIIMAVTVVVTPAALYPFAQGWTLVWTPLVWALVGVLLLLSSSFAAERTPVVGADGTAPRSEPGPVQTTRVRDARLTSAEADYMFLFSATVRWRWTRGEAPEVRNPAGRVENLVVSTARRVAGTHAAAEADLVRHTLAELLGTALVTGDGTMEVWAEDVVVRLTEEDAERLARLAELRKKCDEWEMECELEARKRAHFSDDVFSTPGNAVIWDLVRNGADVTRTARLVDILAYVSEAGKGTDLEDLRERLRGWEPELAEALQEFGSAPAVSRVVPPWMEEGGDDEEWEGLRQQNRDQDPLDVFAAVIDEAGDEHIRLAVANRISDVLAQTAQAPLAARLRVHYDPGGGPAPDPEAGPPGGDPDGAPTVPSPGPVNGVPVR
ncbi:hypothetical protein [Nocardiopsis sp. NPDC057823]|uniref:hypothetical protein n=1 Tax=Nocardiopsis sp. NPDC057823 TaxID=3346256 RepID=UPI00366D92C5